VVIYETFAHVPALGIIIWAHDAERGAMFTRIGGILLEVLICGIECSHDEWCIGKAIYRPRGIVAVHDEVLQLYGAALGNTPTHQGVVEGVLLATELRAHEYLTHYIIDVW
jgi:hypothetical protein